MLYLNQRTEEGSTKAVELFLIALRVDPRFTSRRHPPRLAPIKELGLP